MAVSEIIGKQHEKNVRKSGIVRKQAGMTHHARTIAHQQGIKPRPLGFHDMVHPQQMPTLKEEALNGQWNDEGKFFGKRAFTSTEAFNDQHNDQVNDIYRWANDLEVSSIQHVKEIIKKVKREHINSGQELYSNELKVHPTRTSVAGNNINHLVYSEPRLISNYDQQTAQPYHHPKVEDTLSQIDNQRRVRMVPHGGESNIAPRANLFLLPKEKKKLKVSIGEANLQDPLKAKLKKKEDTGYVLTNPNKYYFQGYKIK